MKLYKTLAVITSLFIIINSCKDNGTGPENIEPGRRDYVWSIDTINPGQESLYLLRMWGSSASNLWSIGASSWSATSIWHYNGLQWKCDSIPRNINPTALFGFSNNEVWLGNSNSTIWKYNGTQWQQFGEYNIDGYDRLCINYFNGLSNTDLYGVGFVELYNTNKWKGVIMHYNGFNWGFVNVPETRVSFETVAVEPKTKVLVMSGTVYETTGFIAKIYCWDGRELKELLSDYGWSWVTKLGDEIFATHNSKIYKYSNKQLILWKDNTGTGINRNIICGRNRNDFFISASDGISHYNGTDFYTIYKNESGLNIEIGIGAIFENDVFINANDFTIGKNLIIHGKLP